MALHTSKPQKAFLKKSHKIFDLAIVGAGPAGISSALQAKKECLSFVVFEKEKIGGQTNIACCIENYAGIAKPVSGKKLAELFKKQLVAQKIKVNFSEIISVKKHKSYFKIQSSNKTFLSKSLIIATGLVPKNLSIKNKNKLLNKKIFSYADPSYVKTLGKDFLIIGSGDSAFDQAQSLYKLGKSVTIAMKHEKPRCNKNLIQKTKRITALSKHIINSIKEKNDKLLVCFENGVTISTDIVITCIGKQPSFPFLNKKLVDKKTKNMFFVGDCTGNSNRYIANACADGTNAIVKIASLLRNDI